MARKAGDLSAKPARSVKNEALLMRAKVDIGSTGAPTLDASVSSPGISIARADTGDYTLVYPACHWAFIDVQVISATPTVVGAVITARDPSAGTAAFTTFNAGSADAGNTAADPASGDDLEITIWAIPREFG